MPLYSYECPPCNMTRYEMARIEDRHNGPKCYRCAREMKLILSPVAGVVRNPAVPRGKP